MSNLNRVILIGRVVAPPELRYTQSGKAVANFTLAVDRRRGASGNEATDFIDIVAWQRLGEICNEFLTKGKLIAIEGRLQVRSYETQDGQKRKAFEVVADEMQMLGPRGEGGSGERYQRTPGDGEGRPSRRDEGYRGNNSRPSSSSGGEDFSSKGGGFSDDDLGMDDVPF